MCRCRHHSPRQPRLPERKEKLPLLALPTYKLHGPLFYPWTQSSPHTRRWCHPIEYHLCVRVVDLVQLGLGFGALFLLCKCVLDNPSNTHLYEQDAKDSKSSVKRRGLMPGSPQSPEHLPTSDLKSLRLRSGAWEVVCQGVRDVPDRGTHNSDENHLPVS
ncbi:hypothetical protein BJV78DRAFT_704025 [Lactifluus subvellereus]|nr:hypothetical protein BJV78DRAFT_704025 [Lactifluus subvellereus]